MIRHTLYPYIRRQKDLIHRKWITKSSDPSGYLTGPVVAMF